MAHICTYSDNDMCTHEKAMHIIIYLIYIICEYIIRK